MRPPLACRVPVVVNQGLALINKGTDALLPCILALIVADFGHLVVFTHATIILNGVELELHRVHSQPEACLNGPGGVGDESLLGGIWIVDALKDVLWVVVRDVSSNKILCMSGMHMQELESE